MLTDRSKVEKKKRKKKKKRRTKKKGGTKEEELTGLQSFQRSPKRTLFGPNTERMSD